MSSVLSFCFSSMTQEPGWSTQVSHSAHSPFNMHTQATLTELSTLTSNQCTLCFELLDVRVCHLSDRNAAHLSSARTGGPMRYRKTCWDKQVCGLQRDSRGNTCVVSRGMRPGITEPPSLQLASLQPGVRGQSPFPQPQGTCRVPYTESRR